VVATEEGVPADDGVRTVCTALDTVDAFRDSSDAPPEDPSLDKLAEPLEPEPGVPRKALGFPGWSVAVLERRTARTPLEVTVNTGSVVGSSLAEISSSSPTRSQA
jgi:hypothetical protein